jgi:anti-anti-sigma factor
MDAEMSLSVRTIGKVTVFDIKGEITKLSENDLIQAFSRISPVTGYAVLLNLTEVNYINSAGIALIIRMVRQAQVGGYGMGAFGVSPHYQKLFRMVGLSDFLDMYPDEYAALQRLSKAEY